ncbi:YciE/YciF family protein [Capsulimonas corticalis]|uniref:YciE/YciF family protein n=1 Tax=Capsulimonas corticalis TaxID=2219043 RepID=A0A402D6W6_9BACT|nr:ferritin-like domain-containing protein [Capsulimonas corticalis]BDI31586.1 YciE/YciF family protein [Capsulimonas corticalis]
MELKELNDLYIDELKDLYNAEHQILEALPKMADTATSPKLKKAFQTHIKQTQVHVQRLEQIFEGLGENPAGKICKAMKGLVAEGAEMIKEKATPAVKDAGLITSAQRVEHYEMAGYGSVRTFAKQLGYVEAAVLLQTTLDEEQQTDLDLTALAEATINKKAASGAA